MTLQPLPASRNGARLPCRGCKSVTRAERLLADVDGRAFFNFYCWSCVPKLQNCCSLPTRVFDAPAQLSLILAP